MADKFILMGLDDERSKDIAEVLGNKTCNKILDYLSEVKEASEKDISDKLEIPINTAEYNLNKLIKSGLIEKSKNFFWSVKGRKIDNYRLSNKKIIISPKSFVRGVIPAVLGVALGSFAIKLLGDRMNANNFRNIDYSAVGSGVSTSPGASDVVSNAPQTLEKVAGGVQNFAPPVQQVQNLCSGLNGDAWAWFLFGGLFVILIFLLVNQYKQMKGGFIHEN